MLLDKERWFPLLQPPIGLPTLVGRNEITFHYVYKFEKHYSVTVFRYDNIKRLLTPSRVQKLCFHLPILGERKMERRYGLWSTVQSLVGGAD